MAAALAAVSCIVACSGGSGKSGAETDTTAAVGEKAAASEEKEPAGDPAATVRDLTMDGFNKHVMDFSGETPRFLGARPCVIDFYATWCGPCRQMSPVIDALAKQYGGKVDFYRVDVDKEKELATDVFGVEAMPTFVYIDKQGGINSTMGAVSKADMADNIEKYCLGE